MKVLDSLRKAFAHTPRTLQLVWRSSPGWTLALAAMTALAAIVPLGVAWAGKRIVDAVVARSAVGTLRWVALELGLVTALALATRGLGLVRTVLGARLAVDVNVLILDKALGLELRHFEDSEFYDKLVRARREASSRPLSVVLGSFNLLQSVLTLAGYSLLLLRFSPWAVAGLLAASIPATLAEMRFSKTAFRLRNWRAPETRRLNYVEHVLANDGHAKEVKLFGLGPTLLDRYRALGERFFREDRSLAARRAGWAYALSLLAMGAFYGCYAVMAIAAASGRLSLGNLTLYVVAFRQGQQSFQSILAAVGSMYEDDLYMSNLYEFLAIPTGGAPRIAAAPEREEEGIRFEGVGFRYPGRDEWVLREVSVFLRKGERVALVGRNGAGKTTFVKLLTRLYAPTEGRILLDGRDLGAWDEEALRARIGVLFQDFAEYQLALRENVGFGSVAHLGDEARLWRAVDRGGAEDLVRSLPAGLDTALGRWFQEGTELSGGQWQKVALARAFMREEADILVLDEPTAALDAEAEHAVFERFRSLTDGRTTILVSHRFPSVRRADRILVLEGGRIVETGTHEELVANGQRYAKLFALQAEGYV